MVPKMFKRTSCQPAWSEKETADYSESGIVALTKGGSDEMVQENVETVQEDVTSVMESEF